MVSTVDNEESGWRREANRYRSLHRKALERLSSQREKHRAKVAELKAEHRETEEALKREVLELKLQVKTLQDLHFGKSSEGSRSFSQDSLDSRRRRGPKRPRGQQHGAKGHGRRLHSDLPCVEVIHDLPAEEAVCRVCGLPFEATGLENVSEEVDLEVRVIRRRTHRTVYRPTCSCDASVSLVSAPPPSRAFPRSLYSDSFWIELILFKYEYQLPLTRTVRLLEGHGLTGVAPGTLCGGIVRATAMLQPLFDATMEHNRAAMLRHMDETMLKVFVETPGRLGRNWCLWQSSTADSCVFLLSPGHSPDVPEKHLKDAPEDGIVCVDRHRAYANLKQTVAYCWAHVRRDFIRLARAERSSLRWAVDWIRRIKALYRLHRARAEAAAKTDAEALAQAQDELTEAVADIERSFTEELERPPNWTCANRRKVLESMQRHWPGLTVFLCDPAIPLDNNAAERLFRPVANFRKACHGVHSEPSGHATAILLSILATLRLNRVEPRAFLAEYFAAAAVSGADAETAADFLPWALPEERRRRLCRTPDPPDTS